MDGVTAKYLQRRHLALVTKPWQHGEGKGSRFSQSQQNGMSQDSGFLNLRNWYIGSGNAGSQREEVRGKGHKEAWHTQRRDRASGVPLEILKHLAPKPESAYFLLCALTYTSDFYGGLSPTTSLWKKS